jgi:hypothetical protein
MSASSTAVAQTPMTVTNAASTVALSRSTPVSALGQCGIGDREVADDPILPSEVLVDQRTLLRLLVGRCESEEWPSIKCAEAFRAKPITTPSRRAAWRKRTVDWRGDRLVFRDDGSIVTLRA